MKTFQKQLVYKIEGRVLIFFELINTLNKYEKNRNTTNKLSKKIIPTIPNKDDSKNQLKLR